MSGIRFALRPRSRSRALSTATFATSASTFCASARSIAALNDSLRTGSSACAAPHSNAAMLALQINGNFISMLQVNLDLDRETGVQRRHLLAGVERDLHRHALHDLHEVTRRVVGR